MSTDLIVVPSTMTEREFGVVFAKLALQLRWTDADAVTIKSYFEALKDFTLPTLEASALAFAQEPGRRFFPTTGEWVEAANAVKLEALREVLQPRAEPWHHECDRCQDTGWIQGLTCDGGDFCGRHKTHAPHGFTKPCPCRATNRTYQRNQKFGYSV